VVGAGEMGGLLILIMCLSRIVIVAGLMFGILSVADIENLQNMKRKILKMKTINEYKWKILTLVIVFAPPLFGLIQRACQACSGGVCGV